MNLEKEYMLKTENIGTYNSFAHEKVNKLIQTGKKLRLDIGTSWNIPYSTSWHSSLNDIVSISVEPNVHCLKTIYEKIKHIKNHFHIIGAIDHLNEDHVELKPFYITTVDPGCSSLLQPILTYSGFNGYGIQSIVDIETFPMKALLKNVKCELIELVKIDTQGKDLDVIKSFGEHIKKVCYLDIEDDCSQFYLGAAKHDDIVKYVTDIGFELYETISHGKNNLNDLRFVNKRISIPENYSNITL